MDRIAELPHEPLKLGKPVKCNRPKPHLGTPNWSSIRAKQQTDLRTLSFKPSRYRQPVHVGKKPAAFWLFCLDVKSRLGPKGHDVADVEWPELPQHIKRQYQREAAQMKKERRVKFTPDPMRLEDILHDKNEFARAYELAKGEMEGDKLPSMDRVIEIVNHKEHLL